MAMYSPSDSKNTYNFYSEENAAKWRSLLVNSLQKVQRQVHSSLTAQQDALEYIESLILQLLGMLCAFQPHVVQDVEDRVQRTFPHPIDEWAINDAQIALQKGKKRCPLVLPVDRIHTLLCRELLGYKVDLQVTMYITAVLEYIAADILKLTGNYVRNIKHQEITCQDIKVAMCADKVLMDMFFQEDDMSSYIEEELPFARRGSLTYEEIAKELVFEEGQYMRDLYMITKVFRAAFVKLFKGSKDLEVIFSNILDVQEFTSNIINSIEDAIEICEEGTPPEIGVIFEEMAEGAEFDVYDKYAEDILNPYGRDRLDALLQRHDTCLTFHAAGHGYKDAVKYVLPKLLLGPIYHCFHYFDIIKVLKERSKDEKEKESLEQASGVLHQLKIRIEDKLAKSKYKRKPGEVTLRFTHHGDRQNALNKMNELQKSIDGWEGKDIGQSCNKFIMEGILSKQTGRRLTERYVFLFDTMIILTKQNTKRSSVTGPCGEYKLKEKYHMRRVESVLDREDGDGEFKFSFELQVKEHPPLIMACKNQEDKNNWMAALVSLLSRSMLERMLDSALSEEEKKTPLRLPPPAVYRFAESDSEENIVFENDGDSKNESPVIKGGTLLKLVERLTYHMYADPKFVHTFLTTFRSFCKPDDLLDLLIERFDITDPPIQMDNDDPDSLIVARDELKRFRNEYTKPVQIRVLNVIRHWVDQHWYDFEWNRDLLSRLQAFLETVKGKAMKKYVESIHKAINRRLESANMERQITYEEKPPPILWHIAHRLEDFDLMTLHPIEIARQVTLLEFDLYRAVKPSELVGSVWIKRQKSVTSPNLLKMIHHSTMFTFWLEKCIIEAENFEERVMIVSRVLEIMLVFQDLNNFNGVLEVVSALNSAPVFRLKHTFEEIEHKYHKLMKAFDEAKNLNSDHYKQYIEKLRSINPPCVPFLGMYLTNILLTEEGNPDFLPNRPEGIINFSKRRKVAEITQEIQQYQNQPYCLTVESDIRTFVENLSPLGEMKEKEFNDYLYSKSLEIEPRNSRAPTKFERKRDYSLKSPGLKQVSSRHSTSTLRSDKSHPASLASAPNTPTFPHIDEERSDMDPASSPATPPTPSTPLTPPPHDSSDNSVFATVYIRETSTSSVNTTISTNSSSGIFSPNRTPSDIPPPLPPRRKRDSSLSTTDMSPIRQAMPAPVLPPRDGAPPLPPRQTPIHHTFPRAQSMTLTRPPFPPNVSSTTLPRRNSDREYPPPLNINGERGGSVTPELPPKTYRVAHSRKQSS